MPVFAVRTCGFTVVSKSNITLNGGVAPARAYIPELLQDTVAGKLNSAPVLDLSIGLDEISKGYAAMDKREALKVAIEL